ncbi:hypothetical protein HYALB_00007197 [Hymenoscyphus albidus]|uniref:Uncharacterized protein n=1 Tax=Hymenoscyphus albidus TaxID=595503 RepID=A0A9N9LSZ5_9HELO|nr:hypothetical protein HYALB_00007197 [Hymenoscyphus albidus]
MHRGWKLSSLLLLGALSTAFSRALPDSEIAILEENHAPPPPLPIRIRSTRHKKKFRSCTTGDINSRSITRRGQCSCKGGRLDDDDDEGAHCKSDPGPTFEVEVCEVATDRDTCAIEVVPAWAQGEPAVPRKPEFLAERGKKGLDLVANPKQGPDFLDRMKVNYKITNLSSEEWEIENGGGNNGVGKGVPSLSFFKEYGFQRKDGWQGVWVHSTGGLIDDVASISIGKAPKKKDGKEYVAIIAHNRDSVRDANRFVIESDGSNKFDANNKYVPLPPEEVATKAVPVAQLVYQAAKQNGMLNGKPEKYFLVSDAITNTETRRDIKTVEKRMKTKWSEETVLHPNAPGIEGEMYNLIAGNDNSYSWLNTIGRNPATFGDYKIDTIITRSDPHMITIELVKKEVGGG